MLTSAVYSFLIGECLDLYLHTAEAIKREWGLEDDEIDQLPLISPPTEIQNLIGSEACARKFGDLSSVDGFYRFNDCWKLDIDPSLALRGIVMPVRNEFGWFSALRVFRHVKDQNPFILKVRRERRSA